MWILLIANFICHLLLQFFKDITITIDEADFKDHGGLMKVLQSHRPKKKGSCYQVRGAYEELEHLSIELSAVRGQYIPTTGAQISHQYEQASTPVKSVDVYAVVMLYIEQRCAEQLNKICGNTFSIEIQPCHGTVHNNPSSTVQVTFRPRHSSIHPVRADFVRQQFITFYQRTASDLQVTSVFVSPHDHKDLQKRFPHLLISPSHNRHEVTVTGPFVHIVKLKEFLLKNTKSSGTCPSKCLADTPNSTAGPSHSNNPEEESCPICMEPILPMKKRTLQCKHSFCRDCLTQAFDYKPVCPTCGKLYGILKGTQPDGGKMNVTKNSSSLPGYEKYGTIIIHYDIPSGTQKVRLQI